MKNFEIIKILKKYNLGEIYFGSSGFTIFKENELEKAQLGYATHPDGTDLTGSNEGDWDKNWVVFGQNASLGDPYFVDTENSELPVYTAMHGTGTWSPNEISPNLNSFLSSLSYLSSRSKEDGCMISPNEDTITDEAQLSEIGDELNRINQDSWFWSNFIEQHLEWIEECDEDDY
jgi:hypothetical protein